jgi:hypothetical protein
VGIVDELIEDGVAQVAPPTPVECYNPQPDRIHFTYGLAARLIWQWEQRRGACIRSEDVVGIGQEIVPLEIVRGRSLRCSAEKWRRSNTSASIELEIRQILSGSLSVSSAKVRSYDAGASLAKAGEVSPGLTIILVGPGRDRSARRAGPQHAD